MPEATSIIVNIALANVPGPDPGTVEVLGNDRETGSHNAARIRNNNGTIVLALTYFFMEIPQPSATEI